jgi:hypothetical protein
MRVHQSEGRIVDIPHMQVIDDDAVQLEIKFIVSCAHCLFPEMEVVAAIGVYVRRYFHIGQPDIFNAVFATQQIPDIEPQGNASRSEQVVFRRQLRGFLHPYAVKAHGSKREILDQAELYVVNLYLGGEGFVYFVDKHFFNLWAQKTLRYEEQKNNKRNTADCPYNDNPEGSETHDTVKWFLLTVTQKYYCY